MCIRDSNIVSDNKDIIYHVRKLGKIRSSIEALKYGSFNEVITRNQQVIYKRSYNNEDVYIALNISNSDYEFNFNVGINNELKDILNNQSINVINGNAKFSLNPYKGAILIKQ